MNESAYEAAIQPLSDELRKRAGDLADYLVTQPPRRLAWQAARDFGWWCLSEGAKYAHVVTERTRRNQLARQRDVAHSGERHAKNL